MFKKKNLRPAMIPCAWSFIVVRKINGNIDRRIVSVINIMFASMPLETLVIIVKILVTETFVVMLSVTNKKHG